jgi:hypothetical protein
MLKIPIICYRYEVCASIPYATDIPLFCYLSFISLIISIIKSTRLCLL